MRKNLLRSAILLTLAGSAAQDAAARSLDFDPVLYPWTGGFPDREPVRIRYGNPDDPATRHRIYREQQAEARRQEHIRREQKRAQRAALRQFEREQTELRRAERRVRDAEREFDRAVAFGDRGTIRLKRHKAITARRALRRARLAY